MQQDRERLGPPNDVVVRKPSAASTRHARGTRPPDPAREVVNDSYTVECKSCKSRIPFATAIILGTHCVCTNCSSADTRKAALAALPQHADTTHLPHRLGAPLFALALTVVLTAGLILFYSL